MSKSNSALRFDFGEWASDMATRGNPDGTKSVVTIVPGFMGLEFLVGRKDGARALTLRDAQHRYVLLEKD